MGESDEELIVTPVLVVQDFLWTHSWDVHNGQFTVDSDGFYDQCEPIAQSLLFLLEEAGFRITESPD